MGIMVDSTPKLKSFLRHVPTLKESTIHLMMRLMLAFMDRSGRMSCSQAATAMAVCPVHKAQICRFVARPRWRSRGLDNAYRDVLLKREAASKGRFLLIVDATATTRQGKYAPNTSCFGNHTRRPCKKKRYGRNKTAKKKCHTFTFALLITPSGVRIPFQRPFYTKAYCEEHGLQHRSTAESAADLIDQLPLPEGADVVVLGDTAYDAKVVQEACARRNYLWIVPCNSERVLAGPAGARPQVRSLLKAWSTYRLKTVRFVPCRGKYAVYRRLSCHRVGPKMKSRTFSVHEETRRVHSVGNVLLVFSTTEPKLKKATPDEVKVLMTNATHLSVSEIVELYSLRWQIELFFKELKGTLGFHQYKFKNFAAVEGWVQLAVITFLYLEWYRIQQLRNRRLAVADNRWWQCQRLHGICQVIRLETQEGDLQYLVQRLETLGGIKKLKRLLRKRIAA
jgi:hypothetical protein